MRIFHSRWLLFIDSLSFIDFLLSCVGNTPFDVYKNHQKSTISNNISMLMANTNCLVTLPMFILMLEVMQQGVLKTARYPRKYLVRTGVEIRRLPEICRSRLTMSSVSPFRRKSPEARSHGTRSVQFSSARNPRIIVVRTGVEIQRVPEICRSQLTMSSVSPFRRKSPEVRSHGTRSVPHIKKPLILFGADGG